MCEWMDLRQMSETEARLDSSCLWNKSERNHGWVLGVGSEQLGRRWQPLERQDRLGWGREHKVQRGNQEPSPPVRLPGARSCAPLSWYKGPNGGDCGLSLCVPLSPSPSPLLVPSPLSIGKDSKWQGDQGLSPYPHFFSILIHFQSLAVNTIYVLMTPKFKSPPGPPSLTVDTPNYLLNISSQHIISILELTYAHNEVPYLIPKPCFSCIFLISVNVSFHLTILFLHTLQLDHQRSCWVYLQAVSRIPPILTSSAVPRASPTIISGLGHCSGLPTAALILL